MIVLHDTHHRLSTRCHLLKVGDVRLVMTEAAWEARGELNGEALTIDDYEQWEIIDVNKRDRTFLEQNRDSDELRVISWANGHNVITILAEGPDGLYASTQEPRDEGWRL